MERNINKSFCDFWRLLALGFLLCVEWDPISSHVIHEGSICCSFVLLYNAVSHFFLCGKLWQNICGQNQYFRILYNILKNKGKKLEMLDLKNIMSYLKLAFIYLVTIFTALVNIFNYRRMGWSWKEIPKTI